MVPLHLHTQLLLKVCKSAGISEGEPECMSRTLTFYCIISIIGALKNSSYTERHFLLEWQKIRNGPGVLQLEWRLARALERN